MAAETKRRPIIGFVRSRQRAPRHRPVTRQWLYAWLGGSVLGVVNGTGRELLYKDRVGEEAAHYLSTASLLLLLSLYVRELQRRWPIPSRAEAGRIGAYWVALTVAFEFGFGHFVDRKSWAELRDMYDIRHGKVWILVPLFMGVAPSLARRSSARLASRGLTSAIPGMCRGSDSI